MPDRRSRHGDQRAVEWEGALHVELQLALRQVVSSESIDSLLVARPQLGERLTQLATAGVARLGVQLDRVDVRDLTLPGDLKKLFTQVTKARQEGLAALERARGETAALRNLANAARMVADNPALMQGAARLLQVVGEQSGNTVVLGMPSGATTLPIGGARPRIEGSQPDVSEWWRGPTGRGCPPGPTRATRATSRSADSRGRRAPLR